MRKRKEDEIRAKLYDEFLDYVQTKVRNDEDNPNLSLIEFENLPESGTTHMTVYMENVDHINSKLIKTVEAFKPGTQFDTKEDRKTGTKIPVIFLPLNTDKKKGYSVSSSKSGSKPPSQTTLMVYMVLLLCSVIIGLIKIPTSDWQYFLK